MALVSAVPIVESANKYNYALGAYNVNAVDQVDGLIEVHEILRSPLIIQAADLALGFIGGRGDFFNSTLEDKIKGAKILGDYVKKKAEKASIPIVLHLDHGQSLDSVKAAVEGGFTSVMYDGSALPFEENMKNTKEVVEYAHARGVSVEAELGTIAGVEDNVYAETSTYTNPLQALEFVKETNIDLLAISYGTSHGPNKGTDVKLRNEIVIALRELFDFEKIQCGIVSHGSSSIPQYIVNELIAYDVEISGASGISAKEIQKAINAGVRKVNVDSDIRLATTRNLHQMFSENEELKNDEAYKPLYQLLSSQMNVVDPRSFLTENMDEVANGFDSKDQKLIIEAVDKAVMEISAQSSTVFGSVGKANAVDY